MDIVHFNPDALRRVPGNSPGAVEVEGDVADTHLGLLPPSWEPTRATLHRLSRVLSAVPRTHAPADPHWGHIALEVRPGGLTTAPIPLPGGSDLRLVLDVIGTEVRFERDAEVVHRLPITPGDSMSSVAVLVFDAGAALGLNGPYDPAHTSNDAPIVIDSEHARAFWDLLGEVDALLQLRRDGLPGSPGPVRFWSHGFDLSFEWFGSKRDASGAAAQLNLGWYPAGDAYFYSNPWPFDERLVGLPLPSGAEWHTEEWKGTLLLQAAVAGRPDAIERVLAYAGAVFDLARPTLESPRP